MTKRKAVEESTQGSTKRQCVEYETDFDKLLDKSEFMLGMMMIW